MRSSDPLYAFYEWISPARFQQHDALIRVVAAEHRLDPDADQGGGLAGKPV